MPRAHTPLVGALAALAVLLVPATAGAAQRWTAPTATATSGTCAAVLPCRIDAAISKAAAGDEIIVSPGRYAVAAKLTARSGIALHGMAGAPRPWLAMSGHDVLLSAGTGVTLRHLGLSAGGPALELGGGLAEDLLINSSGDDGMRVAPTAGGSVLRDSVISSGGVSHVALQLRGKGPGSVQVRNVTVVAPYGTAVRCELGSHATGTIANTIARGGVRDADAEKSDGTCTARTSNLRPASSPGLRAGAGNQTAAPRFADADHGDYRPAADSPTIDAGAADPLLGATDPVGCPRSLGARPDIGAFEYAPGGCGASGAQPDPLTGGAGSAPQGDPTADDTPAADIADVIRGVGAPVLGTSVVVGRGTGRVRVRRRGASRFRALGRSARVPVGSVIDASAGRAKLVSAVDRAGRMQLGTFWGGRFRVAQRRRGDGTTDLRLRGGSFAACRATASRSVATISRKRRKPVRRLWARDRHGRYRTHGANSAATARGTRWLTEDRCDGTLTRVTAGAVAVRDRARSRTVVVGAGHAYLARRAG